MVDLESVGASPTSAAGWLTVTTAAFAAQYHVRPAPGRDAATDAIWMKDPPRPCLIMAGSKTPVARKRDFRLTSTQRSNSLSTTSSVDCQREQLAVSHLSQ